MKATAKLFMMVMLLVITSMMMYTTNVSAYGWGFKKAKDQQPPDAGAFEAVIEGHQAFYREETDEKVIYLTFDNGYEEGYTDNVLDVLNKNKVPATFFVTGHYVESAPELVKRMADEGHIIGNHSCSHPDFTTMSDKAIKKELQQLEEAVTEITGEKGMQYVRPPRGTFDKKTLAAADQLGYSHIFWSLAFKDWETDKQQGWKYAYDEVMKQIHPGAIVLLHTVSEDNAKALDRIISDLKKEGYTFKSLDDLMIKQTLPDELYHLITD